MKFKTGDKVSFVNEKQDGTVLSVLPDGRFVVELEEGFTLDASASELVLLKPFLHGTPAVKTIVQNETVATEPVFDPHKLFGIKERLYLAVIPEAVKVLQGKLAVWLINATESTILFTCSIPVKNIESGIECGQLSPGSFQKITEADKNYFVDHPDIILRFIPFVKGPNGSSSAVTKTLTVTIPSLDQTYPALPSPWCFSKTEVIYPVITEAGDEADFDELVKKFKPESGSKQQSKSAVKNFSRHDDNLLKQYGLTGSGYETDLHIEELTDDPSHLKAGEMLEVQLARFRKDLDKALLSRQDKIVFIHGVGNGRLKQAIRAELNSLKLKYRDANFEKYGAGATEVLFRN